jgi:hypothetical protein
MVEQNKQILKENSNNGLISSPSKGLLIEEE